MISLPGVPPVPGVHDAAPLKEATAAKQQQSKVQQQQETITQKPQPNEPVHKVWEFQNVFMYTFILLLKKI